MPPKQRNPKAKTKMIKKPKLLANLMGEEKRRHHVAAFVTQEGEWNQHEPNTGLARMFIVMLVLHVFVIGGIILYDFVGEDTASQTPSGNSDRSVSVVKDATAPAAVATPVEPTVSQNMSVPVDLAAVNGSTDPTPTTDTASVQSPSISSITTPLAMTNAQALPAIGTVPPTAITPPSLSITHPELVALPETVGTNEPTPQQEAAPLASLADVPPATTLVTKSESTEPLAAPKTADTAPSPKPVPTPSEMAKRPTTPKTIAKTPVKTPTKSAQTSSSRSGTHVLAKGETLYRIAAKHGISVDKLIKANNIKDPAKLRDGTRLTIPSK